MNDMTDADVDVCIGWVYALLADNARCQGLRQGDGNEPLILYLAEVISAMANRWDA